MFRRDFSHKLFPREFQALDELFSREPDERGKLHFGGHRGVVVHGKW